MPTDEVCRTAAEDAAKLCESLGHRVEEARLELDAEALGDAALTIVTANLRATLDARAAELGRTVLESDVEEGTWLLYSIAESRTATHYAQALRTIHAIGRKKAAFLEKFDVILTPTMAAPPPPLGVLSLSGADLRARTDALMRAVGFTQACNASGHPAASVPLHIDDATNLPIGTQLIARMNDEATIFRLAAQLEQARPWFHRMPKVAVGPTPLEEGVEKSAAAR
jgi:Asp-tRNA(Asn)/Glu-tRNA(Gln) amidotransferase A subunit family amidase